MIVEDLEASFVAGGGAVSHPDGPDGALAKDLAARHLRASEKWPDVSLAADAFARRLGRAAGDAGSSALDAIQPDDLYLAEACLAHDPGAISALVDVLRRGANKWAAGTGVDVTELVQRVVDRLLLPDGDAPPRLCGYEGRAPLVAYLKVVTRNAAVSVARHTGREDSIPSPAAHLAALGNPEHDAMRIELREAFETALDASFRALDDRSRAVVAMHYADGTEVAAIAKVYRVNRVTVSRWLADARAQVLADTRRRVRAALRLTESEVVSALRVIRSQIDVRMSVLGQIERPDGI